LFPTIVDFTAGRIGWIAVEHRERWWGTYEYDSYSDTSASIAI